MLAATSYPKMEEEKYEELAQFICSCTCLRVRAGFHFQSVRDWHFVVLRWCRRRYRWRLQSRRYGCRRRGRHFLGQWFESLPKLQRFSSGLAARRLEFES